MAETLKGPAPPGGPWGPGQCPCPPSQEGPAASGGLPHRWYPRPSWGGEGAGLGRRRARMRTGAGTSEEEQPPRGFLGPGLLWVCRGRREG